MAWEQSALVAPGAAPVTATLSAVPANRTVVMIFGWADNTADTVTITDNGGAGNVYTQIAMINIGLEWWGAAYCTNVQGTPTTVTVTPSNIPAHPTAAVLIDVYAGPWAFFSSSSGTQVSGLGGLITPTAILPGIGGSLIYGTAISTGGVSCAPHSGNGFTQRVTWTNVGCGEELIQGSPSSVSATFDVGTAGVAFEMVFSPLGLPTLMGTGWF